MQNDPEAQAIDRTSPRKFLKSLEAALEAKKARVEATPPQPNPQARMGTIGSGGAIAANLGNASQTQRSQQQAAQNLDRAAQMAQQAGQMQQAQSGQPQPGSPQQQTGQALQQAQNQMGQAQRQLSQNQGQQAQGSAQQAAQSLQNVEQRHPRAQVRENERRVGGGGSSRVRRHVRTTKRFLVPALFSSRRWFFHRWRAP